MHSVNGPTGGYPYTETYVWETVVEEYNGELGPYCDESVAGEFKVECNPDDKYKTAAQINQGNLVSGNPPDSFYAGHSFPFINQYFKVYKEKTINYCFDNTNRLLYWFDVDDEKSCMSFEYDDGGNRIKKTEFGIKIGDRIENFGFNYDNNIWDIDYDSSDNSIWVVSQGDNVVRK